MANGFPFIFLVDDDPDDRDLFCAGMQRRYPHINIHIFQDGNELLDFLKNCSLCVLPACMVIDYKMPLLSAPQVLLATGKGTRYVGVPKVVWSRSTRKSDIEECLGLGASLFVTKPETMEQLDRLIDTLEVWLVKPIVAASL